MCYEYDTKNSKTVISMTFIDEIITIIIDCVKNNMLIHKKGA